MKSALDPQTETQPQSRRGRGEGRIWRIGRIWWIQYYVHGRQVRESSHSDRKPVAERLIRRRLGEAAAGIVTFPQSARVTYGQMRDVLLADYAANRRKWLRQRKDGGFYVCNLPELDKFFEGYRVIAITTDVIRAFIQKRQADGAANGTTNRSLALLRRMFHLALQDGKLRDIPYFPMLKEAPPRKGFLEYSDFQRYENNCPNICGPSRLWGTSPACAWVRSSACAGRT